MALTLASAARLLSEHGLLREIIHELDNLENVLSQYFAKKVDEGIDELCDNGSITLDTIESWGNEHLRTSGK